MHAVVIRRLTAAAFALLVLMTSSCSQRQYKVSGKVTYNGDVLNKPDGEIVFVGPKGEQALASIGPDGTYRVSNVATGVNKVVVYYRNPEAKNLKRSKGKSREESPSVLPFLTPTVYASADSTEFSVTVDKDTEFSPNLVGPPIP